VNISGEQSATASRARAGLLVASRGLVLISIIELFAVGFKYLVQVVVARLAGGEAYGVYILALTWANTLAIPAGLGLSAIVIRYVPTYLADENWARLHGLIHFVRGWTLTSSTIVAIVSVVSVYALKGSATDAALMVALALIPLMCLTTLQAEILRGGGRILTARVIPNIVQPGTVLVATLLWYWLTGALSALDAIFSMAAALVITACIQAGAIWRTITRHVREHIRSRERRNWSHLAAHLLSVKLSQLVLNNSDILIVGLLLGPFPAGIYAAASKTAALGTIVTQAVNLAVPPQIANFAALGDTRSIERVVRTSARFAFFPSLAAALFLVGFSSQIMGVFGSGFQEGALCLTILALGRLVTSWTGPVGSMLNVTGHQRVSSVTYAVAAGVQVTLDFILIPHSGITGAAIAAAIAMSFWNIVLSWQAMHLLRIRLWPLPTGASRAP